MSAGTKQRVHVLIIVRHPVGGIRSYLRYNYSRLDPAKYRVTVATVAYAEAQLLPAAMAPLQVDLEQVSPKRAFPNLVRKARRLIRHGSFQLIHSQGFTAGVVGVLGNTPKRLPHILTLHETLQPEQFRLPHGALKKASLALVLSRIDRVIVAGQDAFDNLSDRIPFRSAFLPKVEIIRHAVAVDHLIKDAAACTTSLRTSLAADSPGVLVGFVGRFMPEKGFQVLIDAVERLSQEEGTLPPFTVLAVNDGAFIREYRQQINQRRLGRYFLFSGFQESVAGLLLGLDVVVIPSLREVGPLVAIEAMVLGCPVVASDCVGLREITRGSPALVSTAGDPASLAEALRRFIVAPTRWKEAASQYVPTARREFDSVTAVERLEAVFRRCVAEGEM